MSFGELVVDVKWNGDIDCNRKELPYVVIMDRVIALCSERGHNFATRLLYIGDFHVLRCFSESRTNSISTASSTGWGIVLCDLLYRSDLD